MNFKKFTDKELVDFINSTSNIALLANAENEFIARERDDAYYNIDEEDLDQDIMEQISQTWRPS
jgi:hypothetical protein